MSCTILINSAPEVLVRKNLPLTRIETTSLHAD